MIRYNMGNNEYDGKLFNNKVGTTIESYQSCALKISNKYICAIQLSFFLQYFLVFVSTFEVIQKNKIQMIIQ